MNAITVTREYGAGGYEVARRLAEALGWELLDRELLHRAAAVEHLPDAELERLDEKAISLKDRFRLHPPHQHYIHGLTETARAAAEKGNVVLVGRGTGQLLADAANVFHLRLAAPREWRARRMARQEGWMLEAALARCTQEDHTRDRFTRYFFGETAFQPARYHAIFNTERVPLEDTVASVVAVIRGSGATVVSAVLDRPGTADTAVAQTEGRVLTLARELGAGERSFAAALAPRLGLHVHDRELLEQEAARLGICAEELERVDEQPAGFFQRFWPNSLHQRYFKALGTLMSELAARGDVLLVGRGGARFLRDHPAAFHVRLVAPMDVRVRRVMEYRWLREGPARQLIADSDSARRRFYESCFSADWVDPLEYHLTVNSALLGPVGVDLVALAARRHWGERLP
jgi:cytidylate kinase